MEVFRVAERTQSGLVRLLSSRFSVTARDGGILSVGDVVRLRLIAVTPRMRFRLETAQGQTDDRRDIPAFLRHGSFPVDHLSITLAETVVRSGRTLTEGLLKAARLLATRTYRDRSIDRRDARIIVELADRGIVDIDQTAVTALMSFDQRSRDREDHRDRESTQGDGEELSLKQYILRSTADPDNLVQLMNALAPSGDRHWVQIPMAVRRGETRIEAVLRVAWNVRSKKVERIVLQTDAAYSGTVTFDLSVPKAVLRRVNYEDSASPETVRALQEFVSSLHSEAELSTMETDGFDLQESMFMPGSLDEYG